RSGGPALVPRGAAVGHVAAPVATDADVGPLGVPGEALQGAEPRAAAAEQRRHLVGQDPLIRASLEELADPEAAGVPRGLPRRQRVVGADDLVAEGNISPWAEEKR